MALSFVAVDVETASTRRDSICSIGLIRVVNDVITDQYYSMINPECDFTAMNIHIHGIRPEMVVDAPTFGEIAEFVLRFIGGNILVAHNATFDVSAISKALARYGKPPLSVETFCTYQYAKELSKRNHLHTIGFGLSDLCRYYHLPLEHHHNALDDARACAKLLLAMAEDVKASSFNDLHAITMQATEYVAPNRKSSVHPTAPSAIDYWQIGDDLRKQGKYDEALSMFDTSKKMGNRAPALFASFAMTYHKLQNYEAEIIIIDDFLSGRTYGREQDFIKRKERAVNALNTQIKAEKAAIEKIRAKAERQSQQQNSVKAEKQPRVYAGRPIMQLLDDGTVVKVHETIAAAVRDTKISSKSIRDAANGIQRHAGGFCWKYADQA